MRFPYMRIFPFWYENKLIPRSSVLYGCIKYNIMYGENMFLGWDYILTLWVRFEIDKYENPIIM